MRQIKGPWGRVWISGIPEAWKTGIVDEWLERKISISNAPQLANSAGLQLVLNRPGGVGALGVEYVPENSDHLLIRVPVSNTQDMGLSMEYGETILKEAITTIEQCGFIGSGFLNFCRATRHPTDSGLITFQVLTQLVIALLEPSFTATEEGIGKSIRLAFKNAYKK